MIFQYTWQQVLSGQKTQTRRLPGASLDYRSPDYGLREITNEGGEIVAIERWDRRRQRWARWLYVGQVRAVQPGRGKPAIGRIRITAIRRERVQSITDEDAVAEGCQFGEWLGSPADVRLRVRARCNYLALWDSIHQKAGTTSFDNPEVWVLTFELVEAA